MSALFRTLMWSTAVLMLGPWTIARAAPIDDCNKARGAEALSVCSAVIDDEKAPPAIRAAARRLRARAALDMADLERASTDIDVALAAEPNSTFGYRLRAKLRTLQGRESEARADYTKAVELPQNPGSKYVSYLERGQYFLRVMELPAAIADFNEAIKLNTTRAAAYVSRAIAHKTSGDVASAIADLDRAKTAEPGYKWTYLERGDIMLAEKRYAEAMADFEAALKIDPRDARGLRGRAAASSLAAASGAPLPPRPAAPATPPGEPKVATPATPPPTSPPPAPSTAAPATPPASPPPTTTTTPATPPASPPPAPSTATPATPTPSAPPPAPSTATPAAPPASSPPTTTTTPATPPASPPRAPSTATPATPPAAPATTPSTATPSTPPAAAPPAQAGKNPPSADLRRDKLQVALVLRSTGKHREALAIYEELLKAAPADLELMLEKGRTLVALERWKDALDALKPVIESKTASNAMKALAFEARGEVLVRNDQFDAAILSLTAALQINPKLVNSLFLRGFSAYAIGTFEASVADFREAGALAPNSLFYPAWEALAHIGTGDLEKAKQAIERSNTLQAGNTLALTARARLRLVMGDIDNAEADLATLAQRGPLGPIALQTQQLIMVHKLFKPTDRSASAKQ
jgi:tetratricopeptide (TPR) repeat protein